ncbi:MAG: thioesterase family protein [Candidatus Omnitrophica bacterium]|nr:thioesterase family protein [Candidatus Omnitrophota bacterium]
MIDQTTITVRYAETDRMGVVYYANYLVWFEVGRTSLLKKIGLPYRQIEEDHGYQTMVREVKCTYSAPATYDDDVIIESSISSVKNSSLVFDQKALLNGKLLAEAKIVLVFVRDGKATRIPDDIKGKLIANAER